MSLTETDPIIEKHATTTDSKQQQTVDAGNRLSYELPSDSCLMDTTDDGINCSIPSRILNKDDIGLSYRYNISEFDLLIPRGRASQNVSSFTTKIDRINFSNVDVEPNDVNATMLKIQNPKIEQMRITDTKRETIFPNCQLEMSLIYSGPIANQELETSKVIESGSQTLNTVPSKVKGTILFPDLQLDLTGYDNFDDIHKLYKNQRGIAMSTPKTIVVEHKAQAKLSTIPSPNKDSSSVQSHPNVTSEIASKTRKVKSTLDTTHFLNQEPETLLVNESRTQPINIVAPKGSTGEMFTLNTNINLNKSTERETVLPNCKLDLSIIETDPVVEEQEAQIKRATINFPNQELETTMTSKTATNRGIHFTNQQVETSMIMEAVWAKKDFEIFMTEKLDIEDHELPQNNTATKLSALDKSTSVAKPMASIKTQCANCRTIYFKNYELDLSLELESENEPRNYRPQPLELTGTIYYIDKTLDLSEAEPKNRSTVYLVDDGTDEIESKIQYRKPPTSSTIYYPNEAGQMDGLDGLDISDQNDPMDSVAQSIKPKTKPAISRLEELEQKIWGYPKSSVADMSLTETDPIIEKHATTTTTTDCKQQQTVDAGNRLSYELPSDSCLMDTTDDDINCSIPSRIFNKDDIGLSYRYNISEFDLLIPRWRASENVSSFTTKIDRINFSNEEPNDINATMLKIQNPKIEQMRITDTKRGTIFPNCQLEMSLIYSGPIANQELETSKVIESGSQTLNTVPSKVKGTILFPDLQLDLTGYDNFDDIHKLYKNQRGIAMSTPKTIVVEHKAQAKLSTIPSPNKDSSSVQLHPNVTSEIASKTRKVKSTLDTTHFLNQEPETLLVNESRTQPMNIVAPKGSTGEMFTLNTNINLNKSTERETVLPNCKLDRSIIETDPVVEEQEAQTKRATINFPNQELETTMTSKTATNRGIHFTNQQVETSMIMEAVCAKKDFEMFMTEKLDIEDHELPQNNTATKLSALDKSTSVAKPMASIKTQCANCRTIYFKNYDLDLSLELESENEPRNYRPQPLELTGTIYYIDKTLDLSEAEPKNRSTVYLVDDGTDEIESKIQYRKPPTSSTIYYPNEAGQMDGLDGLDISDQNDPMDSVTQSIKPKTKPAISRLEELEQKIWGYPKSSANTNCREPSRASKISPIINLDETGNTNADYFDMSKNFDEKHIKHQSTMSNLAQIVQYPNEKGKNEHDHEMTGSINLHDTKMAVCSYYEPDEKLEHDLSSLKTLGHYSKDSTYFVNDTHVLCNLDPRRLFFVSEAMDTAAYSRLESTPLTPKVSSKKLAGSPGRPNISIYQLKDESTLQDTVPRFANDSVPNSIQDFLELSSNLPQQSETRKKICNDYINLAISRFSGIVNANSSNLENDLIDQTSIQLVDSLLDLEEEPTSLENNLKNVRIRDEVYQNVDKIALDLTKCRELLNQPSFADIANEYKLRNLKNLKRVSDIKEPVAGPKKPSLRFLMNNYREQKMKEYNEKHRRHFGITQFLPLTPKIPVLLQNKLAERSNYWTCHDAQYNHGILMFTHQRVPCIQIKMLFEFLEETEFGELEFTSIIPMMRKTKILASTFELIQHLQFFKKVPADMKNMCRRSNEILDFLEHLDNKIITKNYEDVQTLSEIVAATNAKIWHQNETGEYGITKSLIYKRNIYDIVINISDLQITDILDVTVKPRLNPTNQVKNLSRGLDFIRQLLQRPRDYFNFNE